MDDAAAIGDATHGWSDLFVASGAVLNFANGNAVADWSNVASNFSMSCQGSPWTNLTATAPERNGRDPRRDKDEGRAFGSDENSRKAFVSRGFGDVWNKYAWSAQNFGGGVLFGTKNAYFNYASIASYSDESITSPAALCYRNPANITPIIYKGLACAELFEAALDDVPGQAGCGVDVFPAMGRLRKGDRRDPEQKTFSGRRHGARVQRVVAHVGAIVDARHDQIGPLTEHAGERHVHAIGRRAVDEIKAIGRLLHRQRALQRQ